MIQITFSGPARRRVRGRCLGGRRGREARPRETLLLRRRRSYDRNQLLADAARARRRGRTRRAIALYREVLAVEPDNPELLRKVAPLFVRTRQPAEAWASYRRAAELLAERGFVERAIGIHGEAARRVPKQAEVWLGLARLESERGRTVDARDALLEGRRHFRRRRDQQVAVQLLREARRLDPAHLGAGLDLAGLFARMGRRDAALRLLEELAADHPHRRLRIRTRALRLAPGLETARAWLRALFGSRPPARRPVRPRARTRAS